MITPQTMTISTASGRRIVATKPPSAAAVVSQKKSDFIALFLSRIERGVQTPLFGSDLGMAFVRWAGILGKSVPYFAESLYFNRSAVQIGDQNPKRCSGSRFAEQGGHRMIVQRWSGAHRVHAVLAGQV
jgi:hypothetical protein